MKKLTPIELKPWTLPLIVVALVVPIIVSTLLVGSVGAFVVGALVAATVVIVAARSRYDEPIEVASREDERYRVLVVANGAVEDPGVAGAIASAVEERRGRTEESGACEILVLAPALNAPLSHWFSDLRDARMDAQRRLAISLASLAAAGLEGRGEVGDTDPVQAVEDALRSYPAQEVIVVSRGQEPKAVRELRRRLDRPVREL